MHHYLSLLWLRWCYWLFSWLCGRSQPHMPVLVFRTLVGKVCIWGEEIPNRKKYTNVMSEHSNIPSVFECSFTIQTSFAGWAHWTLGTRKYNQYNGWSSLLARLRLQKCFGPISSELGDLTLTTCSRSPMGWILWIYVPMQEWGFWVAIASLLRKSCWIPWCYLPGKCLVHVKHVPAPTS